MVILGWAPSRPGWTTPRAGTSRRTGTPSAPRHPSPAAACPVRTLPVVDACLADREPLAHKLRGLLSVELPGGAATFKEPSAQELETELDPNIAGLLRDDEAADRSGGQAEHVRPRAQSPGSEEETDAQEDGLEPADDPGADASMPEIERDAEQTHDGAKPLPAWLGFGVAILTALSVPSAERTRLAELATRDPERGRQEAEATVRRMVLGFRGSRAQSPERDRERRDNIEEIVRKSAEWGYDVAKAGAPKAVPDIEWSDDGGWRITTEVPKRKPSTEPRTPAPPSTTSSGRSPGRSHCPPS